jgi:hypothetical protein
MSSIPPGRESYPPCPDCPICAGKMELVYDRVNQQVCVCTDCHSGLTIPSSAWGIQRAKRSSGAKPD